MKYLLFLILNVTFVLNFIDAVVGEVKCWSRKFNADSIVCVCNETYCDWTPSPTKLDRSKFIVYTSTQSGLRLKKTTGIFQKLDLPDNIIAVDADIKYQTMMGWGGTLTDSAAINILSLSGQAKQYLIDAYFSPNGSNYNIVKVPMAATDFSTRAYTYCDGKQDMTLSNFKLQVEDLEYKIPILQSIKILQKDIKLIGVPSIAPLWMKVDNTHNGFLTRINESMYSVWASYYVKFIQSYKDKGFLMWGVSTGNQPFYSMHIERENFSKVAWVPQQQGDWVSNNLGPQVREKFPSVKFIILDDQRFYLPWSIIILLLNLNPAYIDFIGVHSLLDNKFGSKLLSETHEIYTNISILLTQGATTDQNPPVDLGSWSRGESYSEDIIDNCNNWVTGWLDHNLALDLTGGPNWEGRFLDAPIIVNKSSAEFFKQPMFYHLQHFSKFVLPGSMRVHAEADCVNNLHLISFVRPDQGMVVIILNKGNSSQSVSVFDKHRGIAKLSISRRSITTLLYW